jgi:hypothetical protein
LGAPDLTADGNPALGINGMDLKHRFGEVQANCCDLSHDLRSLSSTLNGLILAPSGAGAIHPIVFGSSSCSNPNMLSVMSKDAQASLQGASV